MVLHVKLGIVLKVRNAAVPLVEHETTEEAVSEGLGHFGGVFEAVFLADDAVEEGDEDHVEDGSRRLPVDKKVGFRNRMAALEQLTAST